MSASNKANIAGAQFVLQEFNGRVDDAYGLFLDTTTAMEQWMIKFVETQNDLIARFGKNQNFPKTLDEMDKLSFHYGNDDPNSGAAVILHESTQGELKARNARGGSNDKSISRSLIISIYQLWEDNYRAALAKTVGTDKNDIVSDIFGDIRLMRNDIIHHQNITTDDIAKCKILKFFKSGDEIYLTSNQAKTMVQDIRKALDELSQKYLGRGGGFAIRSGGTSEVGAKT